MPRTLKPKALGRVLDNPTPGQLAFMQTVAFEKQQAAYMSPQSGSRAQRSYKVQSDIVTSLPSPRHASQAATPQGHYNRDLQHAALLKQSMVT